MIILGLFISVPTLAVTNTPKQMVAEIIPLQKQTSCLPTKKLIWDLQKKAFWLILPIL